MERSMGKENSYGMIYQFMKVNFKIIISMDKVLIFEVMEGNMLENENVTKWMAKEFSHELTAGSILATMLKIKSLDLAFLNDLMEEDMKASDLMENNMEEESILLKMKTKEKESGKMEKGLNG